MWGTTDGVGNVIAQEGVAAETALVVGEATIGLAPVQIVDLEDSVVVGSVGVGGSHHPGAVVTLVLGNAGPLVQLITGNSQVRHLTGQGAPIHGTSCQSRSGNSQSHQSKESLHIDLFKQNCLNN